MFWSSLGISGPDYKNICSISGLPCEQVFGYHIEHRFAPGGLEFLSQPPDSVRRVGSRTEERQAAVAIRREELHHRDAAVLAFPTAYARARALRHRRVALVRRRIVALTLVVLSAGMVVQVAAASPEVASVPDAPAQVTFHSGMTVWGVAERFAAPGSDLRAYVDAIWELNDLDGAPRPGSRLSLPQ